jgi:hypothetical protein
LSYPTKKKRFCAHQPVPWKRTNAERPDGQRNTYSSGSETRHRGIFAILASSLSTTTASSGRSSEQRFSPTTSTSSIHHGLGCVSLPSCSTEVHDDSPYLPALNIPPPRLMTLTPQVLASPSPRPSTDQRPVTPDAHLN